MPWLYVGQNMLECEIWVEIIILLNNNWLFVLGFTEPGEQSLIFPVAIPRCDFTGKGLLKKQNECKLTPAYFITKYLNAEWCLTHFIATDPGHVKLYMSSLQTSFWRHQLDCCHNKVRKAFGVARVQTYFFLHTKRTWTVDDPSASHASMENYSMLISNLCFFRRFPPWFSFQRR
jgi:hypothetical protein